MALNDTTILLNLLIEEIVYSLENLEAETATDSATIATFRELRVCLEVVKAKMEGPRRDR